MRFFSIAGFIDAVAVFFAAVVLVLVELVLFNKCLFILIFFFLTDGAVTRFRLMSLRLILSRGCCLGMTTLRLMSRRFIFRFVFVLSAIMGDVA